MVAENIFIQLSIIVAIAFVVSFLMKLLKQPLIIGYILTGIIISPFVMSNSLISQNISTFARIGVALLLFMVGLNLNPRTAKEVGAISIVTGIGQIVFTTFIGFLIILLLGFDKITALYVSIAIAFSSTIIIMKLLSDKKETNSLYGRISIGFIIVQDIVAIAILMIISSVNSNTDLSNLATGTLLKGTALIIALLLAGKIALPKLTKTIAKSQELLLLFSITWAIVIGSLFLYLNFSMEIGALLAGITLSMSPFRLEISSRLKPLRDFFLLMFFVLLGSQISLESTLNQATPIIILSLFILVGNPLIVMILMGAMGYTKRNGFLAGLTVSQISEFSFILIGLGVSLNHLSQEITSMITTIGLITIAGSTYAIIYSNKLYRLLSPYLSVFERKSTKKDEGKYHIENKYDVILFGYNRIGYDLVESFAKSKKKFLIVDYNPETIISLAKRGIDSRYGDVGDLELLDDLNLEKPKMFVSTIPDVETNLMLIKEIKKRNKSASIIVVAHQIDDAISLYEAGVSYVITPHFIGGYHASKLIESLGLEHKKFSKERENHLKLLKIRKEMGHEHPTHDES